MLIKQSSAVKAIPFLMTDSTDHIAAKTGLSPTVTLSKNGGAFASPAGAVTEIGSGWYKVAANATDSNTLGSLILHATATGADPTDEKHEVVVFDPDVAYSTYAGGAVASVTGNVGGNVAGSVASVTAGVTVTTNNDKTDYELSATERINIAANVWNAFTSGMNTIGSVGKRIVDFLTGDAYARLGVPSGASIAADIATRASQSSVDATKAVTDKVETALVLDGLVYQFTANALELAPSGGGGGLTQADVRTAVGLATANLDTQLAASKAKTDLIPASPAAVGSAMTLASGSITAAVIATGAIDADAIASDAVTELQAGLLTTAGYTAPNNAGIASTLTKVTTIEGDYQQRTDEVLLPNPAPAGYGGSGSAPTAEEIATRLLLNPANKLLINASGHVTATNGGSGGGSANSGYGFIPTTTP